MSAPIHRLLAETASVFRACDKAADRSGKPNDGKQWRTLAACKHEYDELLGKAQLLDDVIQHRCTDPDEIVRRYAAIEAKANAKEPSGPGNAHA